MLVASGDCPTLLRPGRIGFLYRSCFGQFYPAYPRYSRLILCAIFYNESFVLPLIVLFMLSLLHNPELLGQLVNEQCAMVKLMTVVISLFLADLQPFPTVPGLSLWAAECTRHPSSNRCLPKEKLPCVFLW